MSRRTLHAGPLAVEIATEMGKLRSVDLPTAVPEGIETSHLADILGQLAQIPLDFADAPPFMQQVWTEMLKIPSGSALTYGELATAVGNPRAVRAVGQACGRNRMPLIIPCHRVVSAGGMGGFSSGLDWKRKLLELEAVG